MSTIELPADVVAYLNELASDIASEGGLEWQSVEQAMRDAHARRRGFANEMMAGRTKRAQMIRAALASTVYLNIRKHETLDRFWRHAEYIDSTVGAS